MRAPVLLCLLAAFAAAQPAGPPLLIPDSVQLQRDLVFARYGARELKLDLYLPKSGAGPFPAIVWIHGGGWQNGSRLALSRQAAHLAGLGFVGACIDYRLSDEAKFPAALHDAKAAVRWLRASAGKYKIDSSRIGASGGSAGGHLAAMLGTTAGLREFEGDGGNPKQSSAVQAVAIMNPALDLTEVSKRMELPGNPVWKFLGASYKEAPGLYKKASPITYVSKSAPPFLFLHGTADTTVPYSQSARMQAKLKEAGVHAEIFAAEGATHGFYNGPRWFEPALERVEAFFVHYLGSTSSSRSPRR